MQKARDKLTKERLHNMFIVKKMKMNNIARIYKCTYTTVRLLLINYKIITPPIAFRRKLYKVTKEILDIEYNTKKKSIAQLARKYKVAHSSMCVHMKKVGVVRTNKAEYMTLIVKRVVRTSKQRGNYKLTQRIVNSIRLDSYNGMSSYELATKYKISRTTCQNAIYKDLVKV